VLKHAFCLFELVHEVSAEQIATRAASFQGIATEDRQKIRDPRGRNFPVDRRCDVMEAAELEVPQVTILFNSRNE